MFDFYIQKMNALEYETSKSYAKMISEFFMFSPGVNPNDLEQFFTLKFNLSKEGGSLISSVKGIPFKYYRCIDTFIKRVYSSSYSSLNPVYSQNITEEFELQLSYATLSDVFMVNSKYWMNFNQIEWLYQNINKKEKHIQCFYILNLSELILLVMRRSF